MNIFQEFPKGTKVVLTIPHLENGTETCCIFGDAPFTVEEATYATDGLFYFNFNGLPGGFQVNYFQKVTEAKAVPA